MPIFEFRCEDCGHRFDAFFRRAEEADEERKKCPKCGSFKARKLFSVLGLGGGSYRGDSSCSTRPT